MCTSEVKYFSLACFDLRLASLGFDEETKMSYTFDFSGWFAQKRSILAIMDQKTKVVLGISHSCFHSQLNVSENYEFFCCLSYCFRLTID